NRRPRMLTFGNTPPLTLEQALERYADAVKSVAQARQVRVHEHETPPAELDPAANKRERREARKAARGDAPAKHDRYCGRRDARGAVRVRSTGRGPARSPRSPACR